MKQSERRSWYSVKNALQTDDGPAEILIYDEIDSWFGVSAADLVADLAKITASEINVRINSPGGSVFDGIAILNALRGHDAKITTVVDGLAASIASVIAMAGDEIVMMPNSSVMVHNAWDICVGNADDLQKAADNLRQFSANLAAIYADRAGGTVADWQAVMDAETWYTPEEAVTAGLADRVAVVSKQEQGHLHAIAARASAFDLSKFKHAGRADAPAPVILPRAQTPPPVEVEDIQGKEPTVATLKESLVEKLGLDADADDEAIAAKVIELTEAATKEPEPAPVVEPTSEQITSAAAKLGFALVDRAQYEQTVAAVTDLQTVRAAQVKADDERIVDDAVKRGKLAPANRANFLALMDKDRVGIRATLAQMPDGLIPVAEMGHGMGSEEDHLDSELASTFAKVTGVALGKDA